MLAVDRATDLAIAKARAQGIALVGVVLLSFVLGLKTHKLESRLPGEILITSDIQMTPPLWQKVKRS